MTNKITRQQILEFLRAVYIRDFEEIISDSEIASALGLPVEEIRGNLKYLLEKRLINSSEPDTSGQWDCEINANGLDELERLEQINDGVETKPRHQNTLLIKKLEGNLQRLQDIKTKKKYATDSNLSDLGLEFRTLLKTGFMDGKERLDSYNISQKKFLESLPKVSKNMDMIEILNQGKSNFRFKIDWLESEIKEVLVELKHVKEFEESTSTSKTPYSENDRFLNITNIIDAFYTKLIDQINRAYYHELYSIVQILIRKLFENLIIDILRKKYKNDTSSYLNSNGRYHQFHIIILNAKGKIQTGEFENVKRDFEEALDWISKLRDEGNKSAHSITFDVKKPEIEKIHDEIVRKADLLNRIFSMI